MCVRSSRLLFLKWLYYTLNYHLASAILLVSILILFIILSLCYCEKLGFFHGKKQTIDLIGFPTILQKDQVHITSYFIKYSFECHKIYLGKDPKTCCSSPEWRQKCQTYTTSIKASYTEYCCSHVGVKKRQENTIFNGKVNLKQM